MNSPCLVCANDCTSPHGDRIGLSALYTGIAFVDMSTFHGGQCQPFSGSDLGWFRCRSPNVMKDARLAYQPVVHTCCMNICAPVSDVTASTEWCWSLDTDSNRGPSD